jgi:hypothetical protein
MESNIMKTRTNKTIARAMLGASLTALLCACSNGPSEGDAKSVIKERLADCQYLSLNRFEKTNGIPGDDESNYRVEVQYTVTLEPTSDQKESLGHWINDAQQIQKLNASYMQELKGDAEAHDFQNQEQQRMAYGEARSKLQDDMKQYLSVPSFFDKVANDCPNVDSKFIHSLYDPKGKLSDYTDDGVTDTFTETIAMVKTDNGWQAAR